METMNEGRPQSDYRCSHGDLYTVSETIANTYDEHSAEFIAYSSLYTATTGTDLLAAVASARVLPDEATRNAVHSVKRTELDQERITCLALWQQLTSYIRDGFSEGAYNDLVNAAGHPYYIAALEGNWDSVRSLMDSAVSFIANTTADLTAGGMPLTFEADVIAAKDAFASTHNEFLQSEEAARVQTDEKILANNAVYKDTMRICEDGKRIFRDNAAVRMEFTFERVLELVRKMREGHGISGVTTEAAGGMPLGQVTLVLEQHEDDGSYSVVAEMLSDNEGFYKFNGIYDGSYRLTASKDGFVTEQEMVAVNGGPVVVDFALTTS